MAKDTSGGKGAAFSGGPHVPENLPEEFTRALRDINRNRLLLLMLGVRQPVSPDSVELSPLRAAILALLLEFDDRQKGPVPRRMKASQMGQLLGLTPNGISSQTGPLSDAGLCKELPPEHGRDRRVKYYVITDRGKDMLNRFLDQQYKLDDRVYSGAGIERARYVLKSLRQDLESRIGQMLGQHIP